MLRKYFLCAVLLVLLTSLSIADNLELGEGEVLLEPSSQPVVIKSLNGNPQSPLGRTTDTLYYDDGSAAWGYQGSSNALFWAVRFTPPQPCTVKAGLFMVWVYTGTAPVCTAFVWDDASGTPSTDVDGPVVVSTTGYPSWDRADFTGGHYDSDDFWVGYWLPWYDPDTTLALCDGSADYGDRQALGVRSGGGWNWNVNPGLAGDLMIRAIVEYPSGGEPDIDCNPNPLYVTPSDYDGSLEFTYRTYPQKIDKELVSKLENASANDIFPVIVEFNKLIDPDFLYNQVKNLNKNERRTITVNTLQDFTESYQKSVMEYLENMQNSGKVKNLSQLWLTNSIGMKATKGVIEQIANNPHVALIWLDDKLTQPSVIKGTQENRIENKLDSRAVVWNVTKINADDVWPLGYTGENIIVGHIDTGVNYNHVDLNDHLWDGGSSYPNHGYDFIDSDNNPMDEDGHGTHTAGTVAGDGTAGTQTGVAPDAQIMCLRAVPGDLSVLQNAVNFAISQGADVVTMSAGWDSAGAGGSWNYLSTQNRYMLQNCSTAGIVFSTSAGNGDGWGGHYSVPYDIGIPANVPAPWYGNEGHCACMAVGSTDQSNSVSSFSSHGATQWYFSPWYEYSYPNGLIKPDVVAPGGSPGITSLYYGNNTGYIGGYQGTSMSCPHLTGVIALMLEKDPSLTPEEIDSLVEATCLDLGSNGRDNYYGAGLIDALEAVNAVGGGSATTGMFYCKNVGDATLSVSNIVKHESWITSVNPTAFSVAPNDSEGVTVNIDESGLPPGTYYDTLLIYSNDPDENPYEEVVILTITGVEEEPVVNITPAYYSVRCYPNPTRNRSSIMFTLPRSSEVAIDIYDASGRKISTLAKGIFGSGTHSVPWNRTDDKGKRVPQGVYFIRLNAKGVEATGKLILVN
jgi:hypothetical protein